eukprot:10202165-Alexandrium_andersonii.AAC.1
MRTWARQSERPSGCRGGREGAPCVLLVARIRASLATLGRWLGSGHLGGWRLWVEGVRLEGGPGHEGLGHVA